MVQKPGTLTGGEQQATEGASNESQWVIKDDVDTALNEFQAHVYVLPPTRVRKQAIHSINLCNSGFWRDRPSSYYGA